jgi:erythromycin esterase-like protein
MGTDTSPRPAADSTFHRDEAAGLGSTLIDLLKARRQPPEVLALGEPTHGEPAFSDVRNEMLAALVDQGFRSIVLESDAVAALVVDRYVRGGGQDLDTVLTTGFSHRLPEVPANRALVAWLRSHNETRAPEAKVSFHGFDLPLEMTSAPSPRPYLEYLQGYPAGTCRRAASGTPAAPSTSCWATTRAGTTQRP